MIAPDTALRAAGVGAAVCFAVLGILTLGWLQPQGLSPFDSRLTGYSAEEARAYLGALTPEGRTLYLGVFRILDTIFPILLAATLAALIWRMSKGWHLSLRLLVLLLPLDYLAADLAENAKVAQILRLDLRAPDALIAVASLLTQFKWATVGASCLLVLALWYWQAPRNDGVQS